MPLRQVFVALAIVCIAIALLLARGRGPGTTPSVLQGPEPERLMPRGSPAAGAAPEPVSVAVAPPVVQAPATTVPPGTSGPSPAVRAVAARQALERFGRDATFDIERCAGVVNAPRALIPVQIVARPLPARNGDLQPFLVVQATAMPAVAHGAAPTRAAPEAERCLATALVGHPLFIPRAATPAAQFQHVLTLQLPAVYAQRL